MLVLTFALTAASAGFHEFGHAAACRYGGAKPGVIGGGVYIVWPVFYTDVTDSYRLPRRARLRTDLGGLYFNMIFSLATAGAWFVTRYDPLLVLIPLQVLQMTHQLLPFVRLDGYYILSDVTGVPDLFARIKPTLLSALPWKPTNARAEALKPWVRVVVTLWVLAVVPVIAFSLTLAVVGLPRLLATVADSLGQQWTAMTDAWGDGDVVRALAGLLASFAVALPAASIVFILGRTVSRVAQGLWKRTQDRPLARAALGPLGLVAVVGLGWLWWPNGEYKPLERGERWTVQDTFTRARDVGSGRPGVTPIEGDSKDATATSVPATTTTTRAGTTTTTDPTPARNRDDARVSDDTETATTIQDAGDTTDTTAGETDPTETTTP